MCSLPCFIHSFRTRYILSSPGPKPLVSKPTAKGLWMTLNSYGPPPHHVHLEHHQSYLLQHYQDPTSRVDYVRTKCRSTLKIRTWWNSPALFLDNSIYKEYLNNTLGLTLSNTGLVLGSDGMTYDTV